jgi:hypothetical protein
MRSRRKHRVDANRCGASNTTLLLGVQRSPANRHPNPKFQLDQLTTACVALCRLADDTGGAILQQARRNMSHRLGQPEHAQPV